MREWSRVPKLLDALTDYWVVRSDLRLGQIIGNLAKELGQDPYNLEDDVLCDMLLKKLETEHIHRATSGGPVKHLDKNSGYIEYCSCGYVRNAKNIYGDDPQPWRQRKDK